MLSRSHIMHSFVSIVQPSPPPHDSNWHEQSNLCVIDCNCCVRMYMMLFCREVFHFHTLQSNLHNQMIHPPAPAKRIFDQADWLHSKSISTTRRNNGFTRRIGLVDASNAHSIPITTVEYFVSLMMQWIYRIVSSISIFFILVYAGFYMDSSEDAV